MSGLYGRLPAGDPPVVAYQHRPERVEAIFAPADDMLLPVQDRVFQNQVIAEWLGRKYGVTIFSVQPDSVQFISQNVYAGTLPEHWVVYRFDGKLMIMPPHDFDRRYKKTEVYDQFDPLTYPVFAMQTSPRDMLMDRHTRTLHNKFAAKWIIEEGGDVQAVNEETLAFSYRRPPEDRVQVDVDPGDWVVLEPDRKFYIYTDYDFKTEFEPYKVL